MKSANDDEQNHQEKKILKHITAIAIFIVVLACAFSFWQWRQDNLVKAMGGVTLDIKPGKIGH